MSMSHRADQLRAWADELDRRAKHECTGLSAAWCPVHGDCRCPERENALDAWTCPLHSPSSLHAEPVEQLANVLRHTPPEVLAPAESMH
jgi:hypothetical protein